MSSSKARRLRERPCGRGSAGAWAAAACALALVVSAGAQASSGRGALYLLTGYPSIYGQQRLPSTVLYKVGGRGQLEAARVVFPTPECMYDVRDDQQGRIYLRSNRDRLAIVDELDLPQVSYTKLDTLGDIEEGDDQCWGAVAGPREPSAAIFCHYLQTGVKPNFPVVVIPGEGQRKAEAEKGDWNLYQGYRYEGAYGGPDLLDEQLTPGGVQIEHGNAYIWAAGRPRPGVLAMLASEPPQSPTGSGYGLAASTERYLVAATGSEALQKGVGPAERISIDYYDRTAGTWQHLKLPTDVTRESRGPSIRLFSDWLAVDELHYFVPEGQFYHLRPPKTEQDRDENYRTRFEFDEHLTGDGQFLLVNLRDGRKVSFSTGHPNSEVLRIEADGTVLYRANDRIFQARIDGTRLGPAMLVVQAPVVPQVHWAFWAPNSREGRG